MKTKRAHLIKRSEKNYRVSRPTQTGFSSPATHYNEPRIDLNEVLIKNGSTTFYVRVVDDSFLEYDIKQQDVLIIDKSITPKNNQLALIIENSDFKIIRFKEDADVTYQLWGVVTYIIKSVL